MAVIPVRCPCGDSDQVIKRGKTDNGKQRYQCQHKPCAPQSFLFNYTNCGYLDFKPVFMTDNVFTVTRIASVA